MSRPILVACASNTAEEIDGHFGSCQRFLIYEVGPGDVRLAEVRPAGEDDDTMERVRLIAGCQVLFVQSIGGPAAAKVVRAGVHPVKVPRPGPAREQLSRLRQSLASPPPWLAKVMGVKAASLEKFAMAAASQ